jgi:hypothetical protein
MHQEMIRKIIDIRIGGIKRSEGRDDALSSVFFFFPLSKNEAKKAKFIPNNWASHQSVHAYVRVPESALFQ